VLLVFFLQLEAALLRILKHQGVFQEAVMPDQFLCIIRLERILGVAEFISRAIRMVIGFVGALALLMFVYGGVMWMTAGDSKRVDTAKEILKNSTIGLVLIFFPIASFLFFLAFWVAHNYVTLHVSRFTYHYSIGFCGDGCWCYADECIGSALLLV
jgi:hypothetical protein